MISGIINAPVLRGPSERMVSGKMKLDFMIINQRIKEALNKRNITQIQLADEIGIEPNYLSRILTGNQRITLSKLVAIANVLDVPISELLAENLTTTDITADFVLIGCNEEEKKIIRQKINRGEKMEVKPVMTTKEIEDARQVVRQVYIDEKIEQYIADIVFATRVPEKYGLKELKGLIGFGGSPRASINLALASRAFAFIKHRGYVIPEDVRAIAHDVLRHRIGLTYEAEASNVTAEEIVSKIINKVEVP